MFVLDVNRSKSSILWWGPNSGSLSWLYNRIAAMCGGGDSRFELQRIPEAENIDLAAEFVERGVDRFIVACENRWDYPADELREFSIQFPDVPVALAMSDWWLGSRRTGIFHQNTLPHISLAWFRWWDGWVTWLQGESPTMFGPFPSNLGVEQLDDFRKSGFRNLKPENRNAHEPPDILWDDSRLPTSAATTYAQSQDLSKLHEKRIRLAIDELSALAAQQPTAQIWVAWTQPIWSDIRQLEEAGLVFELLAKPYFKVGPNAQL